MKRNKTDYIVIGFAVILLLIVLGIAFFAKTGEVPSSEFPKPTNIVMQPTQALEKPLQLVPYDKIAEGKIIDIIRNRPTLSTENTTAKDSLLVKTLKGKNSGVAFETVNVRVEYIKSLDLFMAEVKTVNITQAKQEADVWLKSYNLNQQGICNLPIIFILSGEVSLALDKEDIVFSPLAEGC